MSRFSQFSLLDAVRDYPRRSASVGALFGGSVASCLSPVLNGPHSKHFQWSMEQALKASVLSLGACATPNRRGSNVLYLYDHGRAMAVCHGDLQSAGDASWPLYCAARHL